MWRYHVVERGPGTAAPGLRQQHQGRRGTQIFEDVLNQLGTDDWELAAALPSPTGSTLIFKRWVEEEDS